MTNMQSQIQSKYLAFLCILYMAILLSSAVLTNKMVMLGSNVTIAGIFLVPVLFVIIDIISEIYGYKMAFYIVLASFVAQLIFAWVTCFLMTLPSPAYWHHQGAFDFVLDPLLRISIASPLSYCIASMLNAFIISKWRLIWKGRHFWIRSIGSSTLTELLYTVLSTVLIRYDRLPWHIIINIILISYLIKVIGSFLLSLPANVLVIHIKKKMGIPIEANLLSLQVPFGLNSTK